MAGETGHGSHRETFVENRFIKKSIENKELLMIINEIINKWVTSLKKTPTK